MRRSSDGPVPESGAQKPLASELGQDLLLLDLPGWLGAERWHNFFHRYREDLIGFLLGWMTVAVLILLAWLVVSLGA